MAARILVFVLLTTMAFIGLIENKDPINNDELVFEAMDKISRHRLSAFYHYKYDKQSDRERSSDPRLVSPSTCRRHLNYLVNQLKQIQQQQQQRHLTTTTSDNDSANGTSSRHTIPEVAAWFDSYAKQEAGILTGNVYWVGHYDECVSRHLIDTDSTTEGIPELIEMRGRYCVAALGAPSWPHLLNEKLTRRVFKSETEKRNYAQLFRLQVGICLPQSCDSNTMAMGDEVRAVLRHLATASLEAPIKHYDLLDLYCLPDETSPLRQWGTSAIAFMVVSITWLALIAFATAYDHFNNNSINGTDKDDSSLQGWPKLARLLSFKANWDKFMKCDPPIKEEKAQEQKKSKERKQEISQTPVENQPPREQQPQLQPQDKESEEIVEKVNEIATEKQCHVADYAPPKIDLGFMSAIKALAILWIINGHIMLLMIQTARNILDSDSLLNILMHFLIGGTFGVDLFFTISGFLASYVLFTRGMAHKLNAAIWNYLFFHRYWRLAPLYLLTFWFVSSVAHHLGTGPLWDYATSSMTFRGLCTHESWLIPATLTSNLHGIYEECMITSWYISCDMQFWLASPLFIYLLVRSPLAGWLATGAAIAVSSWLRYHEVYNSPLGDAFHIELIRPRADIFMRVGYDLPLIYTRPQYRISTYLVGLLAGHYVYMVQAGHIRWSAHSRATVIKRTVLSVLGATLVLAMALVTWISHHYMPKLLEQYARSLSAALYSVDHLVMGIGTALVLATMALGQWPRLAARMASPFWTRLSRLNYALLLLQCEAIYYDIFRQASVPLAGTPQLVSIMMNLVFTLYPMALVVTLVFEYPLANIEKHYIQPMLKMK